MYLDRKSSWLKHLDFILIDLATFMFTYIIAVLICHGQFNYNDETVRIGLIFFVLSDLLIAFFFQSYKDILKRGSYDEFICTVKHAVLVMFTVIALLYVMKIGSYQSRLIVAMSTALFMWIAWGLRVWRKKIIKDYNLANKKQLLIITDKANLQDVKNSIKDHEFVGYNIKQIISLDKVDDENVVVMRYHEQIVDWAVRQWIDECLFCIEGNYASIVDIIEEFIEMGITSQYELYKRQERYTNTVTHVGKYTTLTRTVKIANYRDAFLKRCLDIVGGLVGCFITLILMCTFGLAIKIKDPGPVFFSQTRIGQNGKKFKIYKFRSMYMDAEDRKKKLLKQNTYGEESLMFKLDDDPRIIKGIGHFIRKTSLDELPQLWNILKGDMSIVGPRPALPREVEQYGDYEMQRLYVTPGLSCYWQIAPHRNELSFEEWMDLDVKYVQERSFLVDWKIIFKTFVVCLFGQGE